MEYKKSQTFQKEIGKFFCLKFGVKLEVQRVDALNLTSLLRN